MPRRRRVEPPAIAWPRAAAAPGEQSAADPDRTPAAARARVPRRGAVNNGEPCDRARTPATCNLDCTPSSCGDGKIAPNPDPSNTNDALALLAHDRPTSLGNHAIVTDVAAPTFFVAGMVGGQGGNCNDGVSCGSDDDCASHHCNAQHVCDTPQASGGSPLFPATRTARAP